MALSGAARRAGCRIAQLHVGEAAAGGWASSHHLAMRAVAEHLPGLDLGLGGERVPDDDEPVAERAIERLVEQGADAVFATAPGFLGPMRRTASRHPEVGFFVVGAARGADAPPNLATYAAASDGARYVAGEVAGLFVEPGANVGYVAPLPDPAVLRGINAFALGVARTNPAARVHLRWVGALDAPERERLAVETLVGPPVRAALIVHDQYGQTAARTAEAAGVWSIGLRLAGAETEPARSLTGPVLDWTVYYRPVVEAICAGSWMDQSRLRISPPYVDWQGSMRDGVVALAPIAESALANHPRGAEIVRLYADEVGRFRRGEKTVTTIFTGPIRDNVGTLRIEGRPDPAALLGDAMGWVVSNVVGAPHP